MKFSPVPVVLALVAAGAVFAATNAVGAPAAATTSERVVTVGRGVVQTVVSGSGNLAPATTEDVAFATSGTVTEVKVAEGDHVHKGQLLARIDPQPATVALAQARATLADAQDAVDSATTVTDSQTAAVASDTLAVSDAEATLRATRLRAPISGTVASVSLAAGSDSGSDTIELVKLSRLTMDVSLSESDIGKVHKGQPATVSINAASGEQVAAHVTDVGVLDSAATSTTTSTSTSSAVSYPVTVTLDQTTAGVRAGMSATADIVTAQASGVLVPSQALRGSQVTVVKNGAHVATTVRTGAVGDTMTQVLSGLSAGDQVVITSTRTATAASSSSSSSSSQSLGGALGGGAGGGGFGGGPGAAGGGPPPGAG